MRAPWTTTPELGAETKPISPETSLEGNGNIQSPPPGTTTRRSSAAAKKRLKRKLAITIASSAAMGVCFGIVLLNAALIGLGHVFLAVLFLLPWASTSPPTVFDNVSPGSTYKLAAVGSFIVSLPLFMYATKVVSLITRKAASQATRRSDVRRQVKLAGMCWYRLHPRLRTLLWELWMVSAGPIGSAYMRLVSQPGDAEFLDPLYATMAAISGRLLYSAYRLVRKACKNREEDQEDAEVETGLEALRMEEGTAMVDDGAIRLEGNAGLENEDVGK